MNSQNNGESDSCLTDPILSPPENETGCENFWKEKR